MSTEVLNLEIKMTSTMISTLVKKASETFEDDRLTAVCRDIALEIESGRAKIDAVVEELNPYVTDTDVAVRSHGVKILSLIIEKLPDDYLDDLEVRVLVTFYHSKLEDERSIIPPTILGVLAVVKMKNLPKHAPSLLCRAIFKNIRCQTELQETRRNVYRIFQVLLENYADDLKPMDRDFAYGFILSIDGECDPRNLMVLFRVLPTFIKRFRFEHFTEEMFESVACYFPIDFNASSTTSDKKKVTRDDLAAALEPCLHAVPEFAEFCVPHAMEKLDSDRKVAKIDSLRLLSRGASTFGSSGLRYHLDELWPMLRKEVTSNGDHEVKTAALDAVSAIVRAIGDDEELRKSFVEKIFTDTRWSLCDVQLSLYWPAEKLLEAIAATDRNTCVQVLREIVPVCLGQYSTKTGTADKVKLMETLTNFIGIGNNFGLTITDIPELAWTDIPGLYLNELGTDDNALKSKTLSGLIVQKSTLKDGQRSTVYEKLSDFVESDIVGELRSTCHSTLFTFAELYPTEMLDVLNNRLRIDVDDAETIILTRRLEATSILAKIPEIAVAVLPKILEIATATESKISATALSCLLHLLDHPDRGDFNVHGYLHKECNAIDRLMSMDGVSFEGLSLVSRVCGSIIRKLDAENQQTIVNEYLGTRDGDLAESQILLLEGLLTGLRPSVLVKDSERLLMELFHIAVDAEVAARVRQSACKIVAVSMNKLDEDTNFGRILNKLRERIVDILEDKYAETRKKRAAMGFHTWITKSLVTRGSCDSQRFLDYQTNLLRLEDIGEFVPEEFKILIDGSESTLTEENFCTVKIFYKQRIFQNVAQSSDRFFEPKSRQNYLLALAHLVEQVPIAVSIMHLEALVPLLIESLSLDNGQLLSSTLKILKELLAEKHEIFLNQIQSFIPRCLQLSRHSQMNVRIAALDCLVSYCDYPVIELLKHKQNVLEKLTEAVGDHKRLVRRIAVRARTRWYLIGAPGTPD